MFVLLLLISIVVTTAVSSLPTSRLQQQHLHNHEVLQQAKKALIDYALSYPYRRSATTHYLGFPPFLLCPDITQSVADNAIDGVESGSCGNKYQASFGRFPWRSIGVAPLRNSHGECLWYLVSANAKRMAHNISSNHWNDDADEWLLYNGHRGVAAVISSRRKLSAVSLHAQQTCRQLNPNAFFQQLPDTQGEQVEINLNDVFTDNFIDVLLITREDIYKIHRQNRTYADLSRDLGILLMQCLRESTEIHHNDASLPRPANLVLNDDRKRSEYSENPQRISGRMPFNGNQFNYKDCHFFAIGDTYKYDNRNPLYRHWYHNKNRWFLTVRPNCLSQARCITIAGKPYLALLVYANEKKLGQQRRSQRLGGYRQHYHHYLDKQSLQHFVIEDEATDSLKTELLSFCLGVDLSISECQQEPF